MPDTTEPPLPDLPEDKPPVPKPRLDRLIEFDDRSLKFGVMKTIAKADAAKPRSYTWQVPVQLDQGAGGSCVGHAWAHELAAVPKAIKGITHEYAVELYYDAQRKDDWTGGAYAGADPVYEGTSVLAGAKVVQERGFQKEYRWAFGVDELVLAVGYAGPAVLGVLWYSGMWDTDENGFLHVTGAIVGGHAILCRGVNVKRKAFRLRNSWGNWGLNGDAYVSFEDMDKLLRDSGEACIPVGRRGGSV